MSSGRLSQIGYSLSATTDTQAETRVCQPPDGESSTGTACRPLLPGLDRRSVLCPSRTGPHRICRPRRLRGGRYLQGDRVRRAARPRRAAQGHGTRPGTSNRCRAGHRTLAMGTQYDGSIGDAEGIGGAAGVGRCLEWDDVRSDPPHGRMMATMLAGIAEFERELIQQRIRSGIAAAKARGKRLGRQPGQRPKSDRLAPQVLALVAKGRSYRLIGREVGLSKNTVAEI